MIYHDDHGWRLPFYERMGYVADMAEPVPGKVFTCYRMEKPL